MTYSMFPQLATLKAELYEKYGSRDAMSFTMNDIGQHLDDPTKDNIIKDSLAAFDGRQL